MGDRLILCSYESKHLTESFGVSTLDKAHPNSPRKLIEMADEAETFEKYNPEKQSYVLFGNA